MPAKTVESTLLKRPVRLTDSQRRDQERRRTRSAYDAGRQIVEIMEIDPVA